MFCTGKFLCSWMYRIIPRTPGMIYKDIDNEVSTYLLQAHFSMLALPAIDWLPLAPNPFSLMSSVTLALDLVNTCRWSAAAFQVVWIGGTGGTLQGHYQGQVSFWLWMLFFQATSRHLWQGCQEHDPVFPLQQVWLVLRRWLPSSLLCPGTP